MVENRPIEPEGRRLRAVGAFKVLLFVVLGLYLLLSFYHGPLLAALGRYLVVDEPLQNADVIVCLPSRPVECGLTAYELFRQGLATKILIPAGRVPDGWRELDARGARFPATSDLLAEMLQDLGVRASDCIRLAAAASGDAAEAAAVSRECRRKDFKTLIVVGPPYETRRWKMLYERVAEKDRLVVAVAPSTFSGFRAESWWQTGGYTEQVLREYMRLLLAAVRRIG